MRERMSSALDCAKTKRRAIQTGRVRSRQNNNKLHGEKIHVFKQH